METLVGEGGRMISPLEIYNAYPRHEGRRRALLEIERAFKRIRKEAPHLAGATDDELAVMMLNTVIYFANSEAGKRGIYTPHPSTWFHQSRYLDDPEAWNLREQSKSESLAARNDDAFAAAFGRLPEKDGTAVFARNEERRNTSLARLSQPLLFTGD